MISQLRQHRPPSRPQAAGHLPHTPRAHSLVSIATRRLSASPRLPEHVVSGPRGDSQTSDADVVFFFHIYIFRPAATRSHADTEKGPRADQRPVHASWICPGGEEGRRQSEGWMTAGGTGQRTHTHQHTARAGLTVQTRQTHGPSPLNISGGYSQKKMAAPSLFFHGSPHDLLNQSGDPPPLLDRTWT